MAGVTALYPCDRCGRTERRMHALMTQWFGAAAGVAPDHGYFDLCPACYRRLIIPHLEPDDIKAALAYAARQADHAVLEA